MRLLARLALCGVALGVAFAAGGLAALAREAATAVAITLAAAAVAACALQAAGGLAAPHQEENP